MLYSSTFLHFNISLQILITNAVLYPTRNLYLQSTYKGSIQFSLDIGLKLILLEIDDFLSLQKGFGSNWSTRRTSLFFVFLVSGGLI